MVPGERGLSLYIATQTFAPQTGGMEGVMTALAEKFAKKYAGQNDGVTVLPDKAYDAETGYRIVQKDRLKFRRAAGKRAWLASRLTPDDIVICDSWKSVNAVPPHQGKLVVLAHGQEYLKSGRRAHRVQKALNRATHLVASSHYTLRLVQAGWSVQHLKATAIPPTYMLADDVPRLTKDNKRQTLCLVSICRLEARKGLLQSLEALAAMERTTADWTWQIGGDGAQRTELAAAIERLGLADRVTLLGRVDAAQKDALLATADLFVMPSYQHGKSLEGYGITYAEAARFGVPAIAGLAGGAPEAVLDGKTGWCVDATAPDALVATLTAALSDNAVRRERGTAAQKRYGEELTGAAVFAALLNHIG